MGRFARYINPENVNSGGWDRSNAYESAVVYGNVSNNRVIAVKGSNIGSNTIFADLTVTANTTNVASASVYGLYCNACAGLALHRNHITAGAGGHGSKGNDGDDGANGGNGVAGGAGSCDGRLGRWRFGRDFCVQSQRRQRWPRRHRGR